MRMPLFGELPTKRSPPAAAILIWNLPPEARLPAPDKTKKTGRPRRPRLLGCAEARLMLYKPAYGIVLRNRFMSDVAHMHVRGLLLTAALFLVSHPGRTQESAPARSSRSSAETAPAKPSADHTVRGKLSPAGEKWVVQTLNKMMLDE